MEIEVVRFQTNEVVPIRLGKKIGEGSNSYIYDVYPIGNNPLLVAKCSKNNKNYVSFNLQYNSFLKCESLSDDSLIVPKVYLYGQADSIGDVLLIEKMENLHDISFIINNSLFYGEVIIKKIAETIAKLHNMGISGYDVEFYWNADTNQLVLLDIGPQYTIDCSCEEMLYNHLQLEENNPMGIWNIVSQIIPVQEAKDYFSKRTIFEENRLANLIDNNSMTLHIINVAKIHALSIMSKLTLQKQEYYLKIFLREYKRVRETISINSALYIKSFKKTVEEKNMFAEACLYYSTVETLCKESCAVQLER